jgi:hypothetical protein
MTSVVSESVILTIANPYAIGPSPNTVTAPNGVFTNVTATNATITNVTLTTVMVTTLTAYRIVNTGYMESTSSSFDFYSSVGGDIYQWADNTIYSQSLASIELDTVDVIIMGSNSVFIETTGPFHSIFLDNVTGDTLVEAPRDLNLYSEFNMRLDSNAGNINIVSRDFLVIQSVVGSISLTAFDTINIVGDYISLSTALILDLYCTGSVNIDSIIGTTLNSTGNTIIGGSSVSITSTTNDVQITSNTTSILTSVGDYTIQSTTGNVVISGLVSLIITGIPLVDFRDVTRTTMGLSNTQYMFAKDTMRRITIGGVTSTLDTITLTNPPCIILINAYTTLLRTDGAAPHDYGTIQGSWRARWESGVMSITPIGALITSLDASIAAASITVTDGGGGAVLINAVGVPGTTISFKGYADMSIQN